MIEKNRVVRKPAVFSHKPIVFCLFFLGLSGILFGQEEILYLADSQPEEGCGCNEDEQKVEPSRRERAYSRREPFLRIGLQSENVYSIENDLISNMLTFRPWLSLRIGNNSSLKLAVNFSFPWNEFTGWQDMTFEPDESILYMTSGDDWLKLGRINYSDPLGVIANGLFDGIEFSRSSLQVGAFYTGFRNKKTANIMMSPDDLLDYGNDEIQFAPQRIIGSLQFKVLDNGYDSYFLLGGLAQYDLRETSPLNTYYALMKIHMAGNYFSIDGGASVSFLKTGDDPYKLGVAASVDFIRRLGGMSLTYGLQWFSGTIGNSITPFVPVTRDFASPHSSWTLSSDTGAQDLNSGFPSLWVPKISTSLRISNAVSLDMSSRWVIREGFGNFNEISDYSEWKVDIGLTVSSSSDSSSSSRSSHRKGFGIDLHVPYSLGNYYQVTRPGGFSFGSTAQLGLEIDFGRLMTAAALGEAGIGFGMIPSAFDVEGQAGVMGEVYFADKRFGFGMGFGRYGNFTSADPIRLSYINYGIILRGDYSKATFFLKNYSNDTWGIGILLSIGVYRTGDLLGL